MSALVKEENRHREVKCLAQLCVYHSLLNLSLKCPSNLPCPKSKPPQKQVSGPRISIQVMVPSPSLSPTKILGEPWTSPPLSSSVHSNITSCQFCLPNNSWSSVLCSHCHCSDSSSHCLLTASLPQSPKGSPSLHSAFQHLESPL